jgi:hypothetical protein
MAFDPLNPFPQAGRSFSGLIDQPSTSLAYGAAADGLAGSLLDPFLPTTSLAYGAAVDGPAGSALNPLLASTSFAYGAAADGPARSLLDPLLALTSFAYGAAADGPAGSLLDPLLASTSFAYGATADGLAGSLLDPLLASTSFSYGAAARANLPEISYLTQLTNDLVSPTLNSVTPMTSPAFQTLLREFRSTSQGYTNLIRAAETDSFDPTLLAIPARGYFTSGDTLLQLHHAWPISAPLQRSRESARDAIDRRRESKLEALLFRLDPDLCKLWRGAHLAATSSNPDKTRHACVSIRELITHVMHRLAPTAKVLAWTSDQARIPDGRPTRQMRLLYICQSAAGGALSDYVGAKIKSVIALTDVLQKGTHGIGVEFSRLELQLIFNGIEEVLCSLMEIDGASE